MFYEPKDVVSGDFPWLFKRGCFVYVAAVDCTGHGVPGAMMSVIGHLLMNDIVNNDNTPTPAELLNDLHEAVVSTLKQGSDEGIADGMDIALCRICTETNELYYSGAHRPLYHLTNGEVVQYKGNKFPIGSDQYAHRTSFTDHVFTPAEGEEVYFFSDGLPDQFGVNGDRKFGPKRIRKMIAEKSDFTKMEDDFRAAYVDWKGDYNQTDDILLIGVKF